MKATSFAKYDGSLEVIVVLDRRAITKIMRDWKRDGGDYVAYSVSATVGPKAANGGAVVPLKITGLAGSGTAALAARLTRGAE